MQNIVPLRKMSKKQQKAYNALKRGSWNGLDPVSRIVPNGKAYNRKDEKRNSRRLLRDDGYGKVCGCSVIHYHASIHKALKYTA